MRHAAPGTVGRLALFICWTMFAVFGLYSVAPTLAQAQSIVWTHQAVAAPSPRYDHAMAYDMARGVTVLFGGYNASLAFSGETWEWNGAVWTQRMVTGPSPRRGHAMAYDSARGVTVLFGGADSNGEISGETWEWDGTAWTRRAVSGPSMRMYHAMTYDSARGVTVFFGGYEGINSGGDTWEWNGTSWTQRMVAGPSPRNSHAMTFDSSRGVTVLYGGYNGETWEWNGAAWTQWVGSGPSPQYYHAMTYDSARGVTVLFGGSGPAGANSDETWEWNGNVWTQRVGSGPSPRWGSKLAYDAARGVSLLFGGYDANQYNGETWSLGVCAAPFVTAQPAPRSMCATGSATFNVTATSILPLTYQWQLQTAPATWQTLGNDPGPLPCGGAFAYASPINSPSVSIGIRPCPGNPIAPQHFQVRCVVSYTCGSVTSDETTYTICPADFNCSGGVNIQDIFDFLAVWFTSDPRADFDGVNGTNITDIFSFLGAWFAGC